MNKKTIMVFTILVNTFFDIAFCLSNTEDCFKLCSWEVGQFVEYKIISFEDNGQKRRYKIHIIDKEKIEGQEYFWIRIDIFSDKQREISFKILTLPLTSENFKQNPTLYISQWLKYLLEGCRRLIIELNNGENFDIKGKDLFAQSGIAGGTFYKNIFDEKNTINYSKMNFSNKKEKIFVTAGSFESYHFFVTSKKEDMYTDEGFDLWRSPEVPFLGMVMMEFSKVNYKQKEEFRENAMFKKQNWFGDIYYHLFLRRIPHQNRNDTHIMELMDYNR